METEENTLLNILKKENENYQKENLQLRQQVSSLQEQLSWLQRQLFGRKSERFIEPSNEKQLTLFPLEEIEIPEKQRPFQNTEE